MKIILVAIFLFSTTDVFSEGKTKIGWRDCGIGAMIFPGTPWAAVTSNITWDLGLTASSSSTSSPGQCAGKSASMARFINQNYVLIEEQTAIGNGKYLTTMLNIGSCNRNTQPKIIDMIRQGFSTQVKSKNFNNRSNTEKAELYYNMVIDQIDQSFNKECELI
jgi:hypothetical protein